MFLISPLRHWLCKQRRPRPLILVKYHHLAAVSPRLEHHRLVSVGLAEQGERGLKVSHGTPLVRLPLPLPVPPTSGRQLDIPLMAIDIRDMFIDIDSVMVDSSVVRGIDFAIIISLFFLLLGRRVRVFSCLSTKSEKRCEKIEPVPREKFYLTILFRRLKPSKLQITKCHYP